MRRLVLLGIALTPLVIGCSSVRPYQKEHLADPIMISAEQDEEGMREMKWLDAREGATGGVGGAGGGCGCK